nr:MAG TPA: hypothetical protein [Caudoviricetes sp.]DAM09688.1 MAG TPA: hypothetical protein [Caudoviricetes sp.]
MCSLTKNGAFVFAKIPVFLYSTLIFCKQNNG